LNETKEKQTLNDELTRTKDQVVALTKRLTDLEAQIALERESAARAQTDTEGKAALLRESEEALRRSLKDEERRVQETKEQLQEKERHLKEIRSELEAVRQEERARMDESRDRTSLMERMKSEKKALKERVTELERTVQESYGETSRLRQRFTEAEDRVETLTVEKETAHEWIADLKKQQEENKENLSNLQKEIDSQNSEKLQAERLVSLLEDKIDALEGLQEEMAAKQRASDQKVKDLGREITDRESSARDLSNRLGVSEAALATTVRERTELDIKVSELQDSLASLKSASQARIMLLETTAEKLRGEKESLGAEAERLEVAFETCETARKVLEEEAKDMDSKHLEVVKSYEAAQVTLHDMEEANERLVEARNRASKEAKETLFELTSAKSSLAEANDKMSRSEQDLVSLRTTHDKLRADFEHAAAEAEKVPNLSGSLETLSQEKDNLVGKLNVTEDRLQTMQAENKALKLTVERTRDAREALESEMGVVRVESDGVKAMLETLRQEATETEGRLSEANTCIEELQSQLSLIEEAKERVDTEKNALVRWIAELESRLSDVSHKAQDLQDLQRSFDESVESANTLKSSISNLRANVHSLEEDVAAERGRTEEVKRALEAKEKEFEKLEQERTLLASDLTSIQEKLVETEEIRDELLLENAEQASQKEELEDYLLELKADHEAQIQEFTKSMQEGSSSRKDVIKLREALSRAETSCQRIVAERDSLSFKLTESQNRLETARRSSDNRGTMGSSGSAVLTRRIEELEAALADAEHRAAVAKSDRSGRHANGPRSEAGTQEGDSQSEALKKLEQEHSDLLVCLAEVELECNSYKEQLAQLIRASALDDSIPHEE